MSISPISSPAIFRKPTKTSTGRPVMKPWTRSCLGLARDADLGQRYADKLVKVRTARVSMIWFTCISKCKVSTTLTLPSACLSITTGF